MRGRRKKLLTYTSIAKTFVAMPTFYQRMEAFNSFIAAYTHELSNNEISSLEVSLFQRLIDCR